MVARNFFPNRLLWLILVASSLEHSTNLRLGCLEATLLGGNVTLFPCRPDMCFPMLNEFRFIESAITSLCAMLTRLITLSLLMWQSTIWIITNFTRCLRCGWEVDHRCRSENTRNYWGGSFSLQPHMYHRRRWWRRIMTWWLGVGQHHENSVPWIAKWRIEPYRPGK